MSDDSVRVVANSGAPCSILRGDGQYGGVPYFPSGVHVNADYACPQSPVDQSGNPLLDALPPVRDLLALAKCMAKVGMYEFDASRRGLPVAVREQEVVAISDVFVPRICDAQLARTLQTMIHDGYRTRNPLQPCFMRDYCADFEAIKKARSTKSRSKTRSAALFGTSGAGKTSGTEISLSLYPQVIVHPDVLPDGRRFPVLPVVQIVYLYVRCPKNGSMLALCWAIIVAIDELLKSSNAEHITKRVSADQLITVEIPRLLKRYHVGLLVVDDIQFLNQAASGGADAMLNQFGLLEETLKVPVFLIGTFASLQLFEGRQLGRSRKLVGFEGLYRLPMNDDREWFLWLSKIWRYQFNKNTTPLTRKLASVMHRLSGGIPDFAVKIYILAQNAAFYDGDKLTVEIFEEVSNQHLAFIKPFVNALNTGDPVAIAKAEDLLPAVGLREYLRGEIEKRRTAGERSLAGSEANHLVDEVCAGQVAKGSDRGKGRGKHREGGFLAATSLPKKAFRERAELLRANGFCRSAAEFLG